MDEITREKKDFSKTLAGKIGGVFLLKPSTRTRTSAEQAILQLGGNVISLSSETSQHSLGEPLDHTLLAISGNTDFIFFRGYDHKNFEDLAENSRVPLINSLTNDFHPLQALADTHVLLFQYGNDLKKMKFYYLGDGRSNELNSLLNILPQYGLDVVAVTPADKRFQVDPDILDKAKRRIETFNLEGSIEVIHDPREITEADFVYIESFRLMEASEAENQIRIKYFLKNGFQLDYSILKRLKKNARLMHAMPIHEGEEVSNKTILESRHSLMIRQADARKVSAAAVLIWIFRNRK